jgi:hypothetical protein
MGDQEIGETAENESDELFFEDRLFLFLTAPCWPLTKLPYPAQILVGIWNLIGVLAVWTDRVHGQPTWLVMVLVGPVFYLTLFAAVPLIIYSCLFVLFMPWHAPPMPAPRVRSIIRHRVGRLKTAMADRRDRRARDGGWLRAGDFVQAGSDGTRHTRRTFFWNEPIKTAPRIRWALRALPKLRRRSGT